MKYLSLILVSFPYVAIIIFYAFVLYTFLVLGHWPHYAHPDPSNFYSGWVILSIYLVFLCAISSVGMAPFALFFSHRQGDKAIKQKLASLIVAIALLLFLIYFDPGKCFDWFLD